jgi:acetoin utilization protein AcuB
MLVGERMSHPVITVSTDMPIMDVLDMFKRENIRRAPVVSKGEVVGIVSEKDILNASHSPTTSLSVWELNYLLSKVTISEVMSKDVTTVTEDTPIEEAARIMSDARIGGLPVMRDKELVGLITETDIFKILLELLGARESGIRVTALLPEERGQLAKLSHAIASAGGNFLAFGVIAGESPTNRLVTFKVADLNLEEVKKIVEPLVEKLIDIRAQA